MIKNLCEIPSPAGEEHKIKKVIIDELKSFTDSYYEDTFGNLIFIKKSNEKRICIECGIDEAFLTVSEAVENNLRFTVSGFINASDFADKEAYFDDKSICLIKSDTRENRQVEHLFAKAETERNPGESVTLVPHFQEDDGKYTAFNIKYKAPAYALINAIKNIKQNTNEVYFVFSVVKCFANRGVKALLQSGIEFDKAVCISCADDTEDGVLIVAKEQSAILTPDIKEELFNIAKKTGISARLSLRSDNFNMKTYLTDGCGTPCGLICIPHRDNSVKKNNIKFAVQLISAMCEKE